MKPNEIPGFYYDLLTDRYYKLQANHVSNFHSKTCIDDNLTYNNSRDILNKVKLQVSTSCSNASPLVKLLDLDKLGKYNHTNWRVLSPLRYLKNRQQAAIVNAIARPKLLDSHGGTRLHVIDSQFPSTGLRQYRVSWQKKDSDEIFKKSLRSYFTMKSCPRSYDGPNCYNCHDAAWLVKGKKIACISQDSLTFLKCSGTGYELLESVHLRRLQQPVFAEEPVSAINDTPNFSSSIEAPLFYTNRKLIIYDGFVRLLISTDTSSRRKSCVVEEQDSKTIRFTSIAKTTQVPLGLASKLQVYISTHSSSGVRLGLFALYHSPQSESLIRFSPTDSSSSEISHMQCLASTTGDTIGLLVSRRDGLVQLWENRWPKSPAVTYYASDKGCLTSKSSPIPARPVIEKPFNYSMASPMLGSLNIGLWEIKTGKLLNVVERTDDDDPQISPPPLLLFRSNWGFEKSVATPNQGPALLVINNRSNNWFYT